MVKITWENQYEKFPNLKLLHRLRPDRWYVERWGGNILDFKWSEWPGYENHVFDGDKDPLFKAWDALAKGFSVAVESATSIGKTYGAAIVAFWFLDTYDRNSTVVLIGPTYDAVKDTLGAEIKRQFPKFQRMHPQAKFQESIRVICDDQDEEASKWKLYVKRKGITKAGEKTNAGPQGIHTENLLFIVDEGALVEQTVITTIENTITGSNNLVLMLGNPDSQIDPLHVFSEKSNVVAVRASALDHPNIVLNKVVVPGGTVERQSIIDRAGEISEKYPRGTEWDNVTFQSRVRGLSPKQSSRSLIKLDWIEESMRRGRNNHVRDQFSYNAMGIDPAKSERGDTAGVAAGQGNLLNFLIEFQCPNAGDIALNVIYGSDAALLRNFNDYGIPAYRSLNIWEENIGVDPIGIGSATIELFQREGMEDVQGLSASTGVRRDAIPKDKQGKPLYDFDGFRSQLLWTFAYEMKSGEIDIDLTDPVIIKRFKDECIAVHAHDVKHKISVDDKKAIKSRIGRSPNLLDAVVIWNWVRKDRNDYGSGDQGVRAD